MSTSTLTIRVDDDLKRGASEVADYYGLDLSSVTRAFYKQMVNTRRISSRQRWPNGQAHGRFLRCILS